MKPNTAGIRSRLQRAVGQIEAQHERLAPIFNDLSRALARGAALDAQTAVFELKGAMQAHFLLEEQILFPALRGLYPERLRELDSLEEDHERLRTALRATTAQILASQLELAGETLASCMTSLVAHERREGAFVRVVAEIAAD